MREFFFEKSQLSITTTILKSRKRTEKNSNKMRSFRNMTVNATGADVRIAQSGAARHPQNTTEDRPSQGRPLRRSTRARKELHGDLRERLQEEEDGYEEDEEDIVVRKKNSRTLILDCVLILRKPKPFQDTDDFKQMADSGVPAPTKEEQLPLITTGSAKKRPKREHNPQNNLVLEPSASAEDNQDVFKPEDSDSDSDSEFDGGGSDKENRSKKKGRSQPKGNGRQNKAKSVTRVKNDDDDDGDAATPLFQKEWNPPTTSDLPPLSNITDIFVDMARRIPELADVAKALKGRPLRVATMCSGTEAPILALKMLSDAMQEEYGVPFPIEHLFSCEIVPFKQAYIERNFRPPLLFRDIRELANDFATTCYGALERVPGNCDLLVAGTSCVDYSGLNNKKKSIDEGGESGQTFHAMLKWVEKTQPKVVIIENVNGAPWLKMVGMFRELGYDSDFVRLDTKDYYIPHTRKRGYLIAILSKNSNKLSQLWSTSVKEYSRSCSVTLESFLLDPDDSRVYQTRKKLASIEPSERRSDWTACEIRHGKERYFHKIGNSRPLTQWQEGGKVTFQNFAWQEWGDKQSERVLDAMDIMHLKKARFGMDSTFKTQMWNLSQNVDRNIEGTRAGISSCLTPTGIPYLTTRGGPITGVEALSLQGLPIDQLLLTRETESNLLDLAGNAMSSTVVGTAIIASLIAAKDIIVKNNKVSTFSQRNILQRPTGPAVDFWGLKYDTQDLNSLSNDTEPRKFAHLAFQTVQLCDCEGTTDVTDLPIQRCSECGISTCTNCGKIPIHNYITYPMDDPDVRRNPVMFEQMLRKVLPMIINIRGSSDDLFASARQELASDHTKGKIDDATWEVWVDGATKAFSSEFRFKSLKRGKQWIIHYEAPNAYLTFTLGQFIPEWRLFYSVDILTPANDSKRTLFARPIARMRLGDKVRPESLISGDWDICLPASLEAELLVQGKGERISSWRKSLGLKNFQDEMVWTELDIKFAIQKDALYFDEDIEGEWKLLPKCGTACRSLHRRTAPNRQPTFMFMDPSRCDDPKRDGFVVSQDCRRYMFSETRPIIARLAPKWAPTGSEEVQKVLITSDGCWCSVGGITFDMYPYTENSVSYHIAEVHSISAQNNGCNTWSTFLSFFIQAPPLMKLRESIWTEISVVREKEVFESLAWVTEKLKEFIKSTTWLPVNHLNLEVHDCHTCAPTPPPLTWKEVGNNKFEPVEDPQQAGPFEIALKNRPSPWKAFVKYDNKNIYFHLGFNLTTLSHQAIATLKGPAHEVSWRLLTDYVPGVIPNLDDFTLKSNRSNVPHAQPPNFRFKLRLEQLRSLTWMVEQESPDILPFVEEEIIETFHKHLAWKIDVKAIRHNLVRGGVLADQVGYGKTAITLGLFDCQQANYQPPKDTAGRIPIKATLILVPGHIIRQWAAEVTKFLGKKYKVEVIKSMADLNRLTIRTIMQADMIIASTTLLKSVIYQENLSAFSGCVDAPSGCSGRRYDHWLKGTLVHLLEQVETLQNEGPAKVLETIEGVKNRLSDTDLIGEQSKRLRGAAFQAANNQAEAGARKRKRSGDDEEYYDNQNSIPSKDKKKKAASTPRYKCDPWKLKDCTRSGDWKNVHSPPLDMFYFNRLVVDEFTYQNGEIFLNMANFKSNFRWILSGTPPLANFMDVKSIAVFLNINLGVDHDSQLASRGFAVFEKSAVEKFRFFSEIRTPGWHENRHIIAQRFLDKFVRQNIAEIDEIEFTELALRIPFSAAERALYLELEHYLAALDNNISRRSRARGASDRSDRLNKILGESRSADEALLKRCSYLELENVGDLDTSDDKSLTACDYIYKQRERDMYFTEAQILWVMGRFFEMRQKLYKIAHEYPIGYEAKEIDGFLDRLSLSFEDPDSLKRLKLFVVTAENPQTRLSDQNAVIPDEQPAGKRAKLNPNSHDQTIQNHEYDFSNYDFKSLESNGDDDDLDDDEEENTEQPDRMRDRILTLLMGLKKTQNQISRLSKELVGRLRSLRYFAVIKDIHHGILQTRTTVTCQKCERNISFEEMWMASSCGHIGCEACVKAEASDRNICTNQGNGCQALVRPNELIQLSTLRISAKEEDTTRHAPHGIKCWTIVELLRNKIPPNDKVILFCQFPDLTTQITNMLSLNGIRHLQITGSASSRSKALEEFQNDMGVNSCKVLVLNSADETAAGSNLTVANHLIFVGPLLTSSTQQYKAARTQAIGRVRRFGQLKLVHIWNILVDDTIETKIFKDRTGFDIKEHLRELDISELDLD